MYELFKNTAAAIPVPVGLEERVLCACRGLKTSPPAAKAAVLRLLPTAAALIACGAVLAVSLTVTGRLPWFVEPQGNVPSPDGELSGEAMVSEPSDEDTEDAPTDGQTAADGTSSSACRLYLGIFEEMTMEQLTAHFGRRILPGWTPQDLVLAQDGHQNGICRRDEAYYEKYPLVFKKMVDAGLMRDADITHDANAFIYQGEGDRNLTINVSTAPYPRVWLGDMSRFDTVEQINGVAVSMAYYDDSAYAKKTNWCYSALAVTGDVEFYMTAWNLSKDEFVQVLESLL